MSEVLNGRYELGAVVGAGGMGAVYRAVDNRLGRAVAVKVLRGGPLADETARARLRSEANLAASIHHPGVAQVFDFDDGSSSERASAFLVMELIEGHSLAQLVREQGPMPPDQVMSVVVQVAEGLRAAHEVGVVHRDLKPANIMLTPAGRTVLVDFGIARSDASEPLTSTGALIGTADYMSPEQASARPATPRSDLYALGVVAHHCLTGTSPFRRESPVATALAHLNDPLPPLGASVPTDVADLVASLTAKDPTDRPASAAEVARRAAAIGAATSIDLPATFEIPVLDSTDRTEPQATAGQATVHEPSRSSLAVPVTNSRPRRPMTVFAGFGVVALLVAVIGMRMWGSDDPPTVPNVVGMNVDDASARIQDTGMTVRSRSVDVAGSRAGDVVKQSPGGGATAPSDDVVTISVVSGKVAVAADDVIGLTYAKASATLEKLGFQVRRGTVTQSADVGKVVAVDRSGRLPDGSTIELSVAVAPVAAAQPTGSTATSATGTSAGSGRSTGPSGKASGKTKAKGKAKGKRK